MDRDYSTLIESIEDAGSQIAFAMTPFWVNVAALIVSALMFLATLVIIAYNAKTVTAALRQVEETQKSRAQEEGLNLYPFRRDLLKKVEGGDESDILDIGVDIELLLPGSFEAYKSYENAQKSYDSFATKKQLLEDVITSRDGVDENSQQLEKRIHGVCTEGEILGGYVKPFSGIGGVIFDPDTEEEVWADWDDLEAETIHWRSESEKAFKELRAAMKDEITASLKSGN